MDPACCIGRFVGGALIGALIDEHVMRSSVRTAWALHVGKARRVRKLWHLWLLGGVEHGRRWTEGCITLSLWSFICMARRLVTLHNGTSQRSLRGSDFMSFRNTPTVVLFRIDEAVYRVPPAISVNPWLVGWLVGWSVHTPRTLSRSKQWHISTAQTHHMKPKEVERSISKTLHTTMQFARYRRYPTINA